MSYRSLSLLSLGLFGLACSDVGIVSKDECEPLIWYVDLDGDGYAGADPVASCEAPDNASDELGDCDDTNADISPGVDETCNGLDDNCDDLIDNDPVDGTAYWPDEDQDGYGGDEVTSCEPIEGAASVGGDCDDTLSEVNPGATEICNGIDDNCNGVIDSDAADATTWYLDGDSDGYGNPDETVVECDQPSQYVDNGDDCDDSDPNAYPGASEVFDDGVDQDCDGSDASSTPNPVDFTTPGESTFVVPAGVQSIQFELWGAGGAGGSQSGATGGGGAYVLGEFGVTPGETLTIMVGEGGVTTGDGGGSSVILDSSSTVWFVAAGGGGGGSDGNSGNSCTGGRGGAGGADQGENGTDKTSGLGGYCDTAQGGTGGSLSSGGTGGVYYGQAPYPCEGEDGAYMEGGASNGTYSNCYVNRASWWEAGGGQANGGGGGGGAGYYGGGGAGFFWTYCGGGGGGGSSYAHSSANSVTKSGGSQQNPGNASSANGAGLGGDRAYNPSTGAWDSSYGLGADGRVTLSW